MPGTTRPSSNRKSHIVALVLLVALTLAGVSLSTGSDLALEDAQPPSRTLSVDEGTYYEYVAPRLDRLVIEVDKVVQMVDGKSRDIIALTVSGNRIEELSNEILEFGASNGVPQRFVNVHKLIESGAETATYTFGEARSALRQFNFSQMTTLVSKFNDAAGTLHAAQDQMTDLVGSEAAISVDA